MKEKMEMNQISMNLFDTKTENNFASFESLGFDEIKITPDNQKRQVSLYYDPTTNRIGIRGILLYEYTFQDRQKMMIEGEDCIAIPATKINMLAAESVGELEFTSSAYRLKRDELFAVNPILLEKWHSNPIVQKIKRQLMKHQVAFCAEYLDRDGAINGSEAGTGKTSAAAALLAAKNLRRVLIVAPKDIVPQWETELEKLFTEEHMARIAFFDTTIYATSKQKNEFLTQIAAMVPMTEKADNDFTIYIGINYESLSKTKELIKEFRPEAIVFDESWKIASPKTQVTQSALDIFFYARKFGKVFGLCLTGNIIKNHAGDLFNQLVITTGEMQPYGYDYEGFCGAFCNSKTAHFGKRSVSQMVGCSNVQNLIQLVGDQLFRINKASCIELPERSAPRFIKVPFGNDFSNLYRDISNDTEYFSVYDLDGNRGKHIRLSQMTSGIVRPNYFIEKTPIDFFKDYNETNQTELGIIDRINPPGKEQCLIVDNSKVDATAKIVEWHLKNRPDGKLIVWCTKTSELFQTEKAISSILSAYDLRSEIIYGATPNNEVENLKEEFNNRESNLAVLILQIRKMAAGHNLQGCDVMVYFSHTWSHLLHSQSTNRSERLGRVGSVEYIYLIGYGNITKKQRKTFATIDRRIVKCLVEKKDFSASIEMETI
jgi:hypothetical protein